MPELTLPEQRARLEELREQSLRYGTRGKTKIWRYDLAWILTLAYERLEQLEREAVSEAQARYASCQHDWKEEHYGVKCNKCDSFHAYGTAPWEAPIEQR